MGNVVVWLEIPVKDLNRAAKFYSKVLGIEVQPIEEGPNKMAFFPFAPGVASGALVESKENAPNEKGSLVYLNGGGDLSLPLKRVERPVEKFFKARSASASTALSRLSRIPKETGSLCIA